MKKTTLIPVLVVLLSGCTFEPDTSSSTSSSEGPKVLEAPTIDKVAAKLENYREVGLSHYKFSHRDMNRNFVFGDFNRNDYYTIEANQYTNGSDAIKTVYACGSSDALTIDRVYSTGPLKTYKLDDDYYVYGYVSDRNGMDQNDSFIDILERNRFNDETDMEYYSNALNIFIDAFDNGAFWPVESGYTIEEYTVELVDGYYYCEIGATAPETDWDPEEDNHAWAKLDPYTYDLIEVGLYMQGLCPSDSEYAGQIGSMSQIVLSDMVSAPLVEGEIEPFNIEEVPVQLVSDYRPTPIENLTEGNLSGAEAMAVLLNMRTYCKGTNYSHHEFYEEVGHGVFENDTYQWIVDYYASCFEEYSAVENEIMTVSSYKDDDNDPNTPHKLQQSAINYCVDEGIISSVTYQETEYMPQMTMSHLFDGSEIYSLDDYLNPNGYYNGYYGMVFSEVASYGWGYHEGSWNNFEYELVTATNIDGVIDIEFNINFEANEMQDAHSDTYVIQITDNFCNKIAKKTNGSPYFDTFYNYKIEPMNY